MRPQRLFLIISAVVSATLWTYACGDGTTGPPAPPPDPPRPTTITVSPATAELTALGATVQLSAEVRDQNGQVMAGTTVTWASSAPAVATVGASGLVTAVANGTATITATAGPASGSATVTVAQEVSAVTVTPDTATVLEGDTLRLAATATDANGQVVAGVDFTWASGDTAVAVVDSTGLVTGVGAGEVQVMATAAGVTGLATLTVLARVPTTVAVTPDTVMLTAVEQTAQLTAEVRDQAGRVMDVIPVAWSSADTTVAVVDSTGLVTAVGSGAATITARAGEASGDALVTVMQSADSVTVSPPANTIAVGDTLRLVAEAYDESGHAMAGASFTWSSSNAAVATVDPSGLVRGAGEGTATITATAGEASGDALVTVTTVTNSDQAALVALYNATDGPNWVNNVNWLTDAPLGEWYGVRTNAEGRVVQISLQGQYDSEARKYIYHGLRGELPAELANLTELTGLYLGYNSLVGPIPPELGNLAELTSLFLNWNSLVGPIPPELGNLAKLETLDLNRNRLSGPIPPELGNLAELNSLDLWSNDFSGSIPSELGNLPALRTLILGANSLTGPIPPELGNLADLRTLHLRANDLTGPIPPELGNLADLVFVDLRWNHLIGPIPLSFLQLGQLQRFWVRGQDVCVPGASSFVAWWERIEIRDTEGVIFCNAADAAALKSLYDRTDGAGWTESDGWLGDDAVEEWYGVTADSLGHVTELDLEGNGLTGRLSAALGNMTRLTRLRIADNGLTGRLPGTLTELPLVEFRYSETELCVPAEASFRVWLNAIASHEGTGVNCGPPSDRDILEILYDATVGPNWTNHDNWLTDAPLRDWYGVAVDGKGRVSGLTLDHNNLTGPIPPELGNLSELTELNFWDNNLSGRIPSELGDLTELEVLTLVSNNLTGPIPSELANLANLAGLQLDSNDLTGPIPEGLGNLAKLVWLLLSSNNLSGPIPGELGNLANLALLSLDSNDLTGPIPEELGNLGKLQQLILNDNGLTGSIPEELGNLANLSVAALGIQRPLGLGSIGVGSADETSGTDARA